MEMNPYVTGETIRLLREKNRLTQAELAEKLCVSDKAVSKWETGKGYPDITLLEPLAKALTVSVTELLSGNAVTNSNRAANMLRSVFYVCPVCGNVVLRPAEAEPADATHELTVECVEDEFFVTVRHDMTKQHYISFIAAASSDRLQLVKLYPEGNAEARFKMAGVRRFYYYCNRDGLFCAAR